ncbi:hypothetical protein [Nocardioides sp. SYSU DS0663]|uniref:hypothetical protein n=1 Tax=Nocardioides sp. SYSU DS0663 TaxID=3416445 RepID=UPI003F4C891F
MTTSATQVRRPWRATVRTVFQALVGLAALAPLIAGGVEEATSYDLDGVPFVVVALGAAAAVTRVMAIPEVEAFLRRFVPFLAAQPERDERGATDARLATIVLAVVAVLLLLALLGALPGIR